MKIIWSPLAVENAGEISDYIALDSPSAAADWVDELFRKTDALQEQPELGRIVPELEELNLRELIFGNYRIIYSVEQNEIHIHTVRNFKRLLEADDVGL